MVTDKQVRRLFAMKNKVKYLYQFADTAGLKSGEGRKRPHFGVLSARTGPDGTGPNI